jgi:spore coat polysaccharide biosynthesis protein SpsF
VALDVSDPVEQRYVMTLRRAGRAVVLIENDGPGRLAAHLTVGRPTQPTQSWRGALGDHVASPAFAILGEPFRPTPMPPHGTVRVLVTMGGNDPDGMTLTALAALDRIENPIQRVLVVGPGFQRHAELQQQLGRAETPYEVHYNVPAMAPLVAAADVAVAAFGMSAYELAAAAVPAVLVPRCQADRPHAERFAAVGAAVVADRTPEAIADAVQPLVVGAGLRRRLGYAAERFVDGRGTDRVAELLLRLTKGPGGSTRRKARGGSGAHRAR